MATFAPQLQPMGAPDWTREAKPISDIVPDKSAGLTLAAAGEALDSGASLIDTTAKNYLKDKAETGVNNLRDAQTEALVATRNMQITQGGDTSAPTSLMPDTGPAVPQGVQNGVAKLNQLSAAQAQGGGKINDTLYTGAVNALAKQMRAQYPGYKDYIDEQIKKVSGIDPANAFMKNLMEDINRDNENKKTEVNATRTMLRGLVTDGVTDHSGVKASDVLAAYDAGKIDINQANKWVNQTQSLNYLIKQKAAVRADQNADQADAKTQAQKDLSDISGKAVSNAWTSLSIGKNTDTPQKLVAFLQSHAGKGDVSDEQAQAIGQQLVAMRQQLFQSQMAVANQGGKNSLISKLGGDPTEAAKTINGQLSTLDLAIQDVFNKNWGSAYSHMNFNNAIKADTTSKLYNVPDDEVRKYNRAVGAINEISPQFARDFFQQSLVGDVPQHSKEWLKSTKMNILVPDENGKLTYVQEAIADGKGGQGGAVTSPKTWRDLINFSSNISNPKINEEQRYNIARGFYDPSHNSTLLSDDNFQLDRVINGKQVPGKYSVWSQLTSQGNMEGVAQLAKTHPDVIPMVRAFGEQQFGEQLFSREILDLRGAAEDPSKFKIKYIDQPGQPPRFEALNPDGTPLNTPYRGNTSPVTGPMSASNNMGYTNHIQATVNRLNQGMTGLYNVYKTTGSTDPNADILGTMNKYGFSRNEQEPGGFVSKLWNAIIGSQQDTLEKISKRRENFQEKE
jgi:hypothetical protein